MPTVARRTKQFIARIPVELHEELERIASQRHTSMTKWAVAAFREKMARDQKAKVTQPLVANHYEDARDEFERTWNRTLNRWLRKPGRWRCVLELLAQIWNLPELPKTK